MIGLSSIDRISPTEVAITCYFCHRRFEITFTKEQQAAWENGAHIQNVLPSVSKDLRELFISGICGGCFDDAFGDDNDD